MYHLYNTTGFIVRSANIGEANKLLFIFTEDLGLIGVRAQAARKVSSKLRYSLKDGTFARFSFVRGKTAWRLTDAEEIFSFSPATEPEKTKIFTGLLSLVGRFVHGQEENVVLFHELKNLTVFLKNGVFVADELRRFETLAVFKILSALGYAGTDRMLARFSRAALDEKLLQDFEPFRKEALREINRALEESHL